ncbi:MAG TPA: tetratricopeptide repeat protein [Verrucomicrobiae bacterium]|nr:tetratricopeptide repeat protein [Verrucomicrobiae bacterium]
MSRPRFIALLLALLTLLAFLPATRDQFLVYDDQDYVAKNPEVLNGLTWSGIKWAFTTGYASNWHPLTWLSLMLDAQLFGPNAGAFHFVNALFHAANTVLLFALLLRLTKALWPSTIVAALFAWHPLHVESVAWVSERKDVLSMFFALLTLLVWTRFVDESKAQSPKSKKFYALALVLFALALMAKPMFVTLPFVLLLLDFWPLNRIRNLAENQNSNLKTQNFSGLVVEKIPFFALTVASCIATYVAQHNGGAMMTLQDFPLNLRLENAIISYGRYLLMTVWPVNLAVIYPLPNHLRWIHAAAAISAAVLIAISLLVWRARRACPYLLVGWLWFLGTLVPVIGIVKVGDMALADRYTYFPLVGIFIAAVFGARDLANRFHFPRTGITATTVAIFCACIFLMEKQLSYWRDDETLFKHALAVTTDNTDAIINYGVALEDEGQVSQALAQYREAARISPDSVKAHYNVGNALDKLGQPQEALPEHLLAVKLDPNSPLMHEGAGDVLEELGRFNEAMNQFEQATQLDATYPWAYFQMGKVLLEEGRDIKAIAQFKKSLQLAPDNYEILAYVAHVLAADENPDIRDGKAALLLALKANNLTDGSNPVVLDALGMACAATGDYTNAVAAVQHALDLANDAKMTGLEPLQQRLALYKNHRPWRESFLSTNVPPKN